MKLRVIDAPIARIGLLENVSNENAGSASVRHPSRFCLGCGRGTCRRRGATGWGGNSRTCRQCRYSACLQCAVASPSEHAGNIRTAEALSRQRGDHLLARIAQSASAAGIAVTTESISAPLVVLRDRATIQARNFDLALIGLRAGDPSVRMTAEAVIFGSGRPSILLPDPCDIDTFDHVAIAWDGSRVAARAVGDALPFLDRARRISILTMVGEKQLAEDDAGESLADGLRRRGLKAGTASLDTQDRPIAETLQQRAIERGANLLIMGGYGHSRVRDFVLGGATEGVLSNPLMRVLISH